MADAHDPFLFTYAPEVYQKFYQHPPLMLWLQAEVYKIFSGSHEVNEAIARLLPAGMAIGTVMLVFSLGTIVSSVTGGLISSLVLLTSTRFLKWGTNNYLDGPITFFLVLSLYFFILAWKSNVRLKSIIFSMASGIAALFAFMTKGVIAFSIFPILGSVVLFHFRKNELFKISYLFWFLLSAFSVLLAWLYLFHGLEFLNLYFSTSANRVQVEHFYFDPWTNLYSRWLPWWPLLTFAIFLNIKNKWFLTFLLSALTFPLAFSFGKIYMEHYLTPFYPFAALALGVAYERYPYLKVNDSFLKYFKGFIFLLAVLLATFTPPLHLQTKTPPDLWLAELSTLPKGDQNRLKVVAFTEHAADLWIGIAYVQGRSRYKAIGQFPLNRETIDQTILITRANETPHPSWKKIDCFFVEGFIAYAKDGETWCKNK